MSHQLFLTFPDGVLSYDCATCCDKNCCHSGGINLSPNGHGGELLRRYPIMQLEVQPQAGNMLYAPVLPSGCRFAASGKCTIHNETFYPAYCRLYPFTLLSIVGDTIVIGPDPRCPLKTVNDGSGIKHSDISAQMESLEPCVIPVTANRKNDDLAKEMIIRDTSADCLRNGDSLGSLLAFSYVVDQHSVDELADLDVTAEMASFAESLESVLPDWLDLIGLGGVPEKPCLVLEQQLLAYYSTQRLFGRWEDAKTFAFAFAGLGSYLFRLPKTLQERMTPLDVCQYFSSLEPLLWHLVHWREKPNFAGHLPEVWQHLNETMNWGAFLISQRQSLPATTIVELRLIYEDLREGLSWT